MQLEKHGIRGRLPDRGNTGWLAEQEEKEVERKNRKGDVRIGVIREDLDRCSAVVFFSGSFVFLYLCSAVEKEMDTRKGSRSESKGGGKKAEVAGVGSAPLEEWHGLISSRERERGGKKNALTSFPDWFPFPRQILGQARIKQRKRYLKGRYH